ncbi:Helicase SWR1 [Frankliniella fusca]|uniref:Helicase SWR1 n=1 Tax=Frankliniella fusca TaxID=407009 RepID=A0AAE1HER1_9NEOP|nr:Helicase SWR1 [Frankliniella fusca]
MLYFKAVVPKKHLRSKGYIALLDLLEVDIGAEAELFPLQKDYVSSGGYALLLLKIINWIPWIGQFLHGEA